MSGYIDFVIFSCILIGGFERSLVRRINKILDARVFSKVFDRLLEKSYIVQSTFQSGSFPSAGTIHRVVQRFIRWFGLFLSGIGRQSILRYPLIISMVD